MFRASGRQLARDLVHETQRDLAHLLGFQVTDRVWQLHVRMATHAFSAELKYRDVRESLRRDHRGWNSALLELYRVVHTAQRAGPSSPEADDRYLHLARELVDERVRRRFGIMILA